MFSSNTSQISSDALFIEDVMSTFLYTGDRTARNIVNGIDLAGKGGMVWTAARNVADNKRIWDSERGVNKDISTNSTAAQSTRTGALTAFNADGFSLGTDPAGVVNANSGEIYASWTFRKAPKFFDVVTWSGNEVSGRQISHALGSVPGCIIVKCLNDTRDWWVYHRSLGATKTLILNDTASQQSYAQAWNNTEPTSTVFTVGNNFAVNGNGGNYVAYLFAHDAGGFGLSGEDNVISCGSFTTDGSGNATVSLGYEPQWVMVKASSTTSNWEMYDSMRGLTATSASARLYPNLSSAEGSTSSTVNITSTGFMAGGNMGAGEGGVTYIYIAIRRGPMKVPESGTSVFAPVQYTTSPEGFITGFPVDFGIAGNAAGTDKWYWQSRLQGAVLLNSASTAAEVGSGSAKFDMMNGYGTGFSTAYWAEGFRRAPGFMDVVCYTGTGSTTTVSHNLGVAPELIIIKRRSLATNWPVFAPLFGNPNDVAFLNLTNAKNNEFSGLSQPTSTVFSIGNYGTIGSNGATYVAYLFASCPGVSKVGSYTGNGSSQTINCGFTAGARFVLVKATSTTGDWLVADSARGIVSGNDPYLELNTTNAEVTGEDWLDTDSSGFVVNEVAGSNANTNGVTYIYLAIA